MIKLASLAAMAIIMVSCWACYSKRCRESWVHKLKLSLLAITSFAVMNDLHNQQYHIPISLHVFIALVAIIGAGTLYTKAYKKRMKRWCRTCKQ